MAKLRHTGSTSTLSLTPLIDVVFLILIFFLVTSEFEDEEKRLDIVLPSATSAVPMTGKPREIIVDIDQQGNVFLSGQPTSLDELNKLLKVAAATNPTNQSVVIRADRATAFQPVVDVMNICNQTGISDYSVTTSDAP